MNHQTLAMMSSKRDRPSCQWLSAMALLFSVFSFQALAGQFLRINFPTVQGQAVSPTSSGFNTNDVSSTWQIADPQYQANVTLLQPKNLRWPGGGAAGRFDWRTGDIPTSMIDRSVELGLTPDPTDAFNDQIKVRAKGGLSLEEYYDSIVVPQGAGLILTINSLTDIPEFPLEGEPPLLPSEYAQSATDLAIFVRDHGIQVAYWDLMNEPYLQNKMPFLATIGQQLQIVANADESLGHYDGRVYMEWMHIFSDAIKLVLPDAKTMIKPAWVKPGTFTYNGVSDPLYQYNFNQAIWDYAAEHGVFYDAISFHWYPCLPLETDTLEMERDCVSGSPLYVEKLIKDYYIANNRTYLDREDMPILITEINLAKGHPLNGSIYDGVFLADMLLRMARIPQVKSIGVHVLVGGGTDRDAFSLYNSGYWTKLANDTYGSTPEAPLALILPYIPYGLISYTSYADHLDENNQPIQNAVLDSKSIGLIPNYLSTLPFSNYRSYFSAHGNSLRVINNVLAHAVATYPAIRVAGKSAMVAIGPQPTNLFDTGLGTTITSTSGIVALGVLDDTGKRHAVIINKSAVPHQVQMLWNGASIGNQIWTHDWVSADDYTLENTDEFQNLVDVFSETKQFSQSTITIPAYSVNSISFDF